MMFAEINAASSKDAMATDMRTKKSRNFNDHRETALPRMFTTVFSELELILNCYRNDDSIKIRKINDFENNQKITRLL